MLDLEDRAARRPGEHARDQLPAVEVAEEEAAAVDVDERDAERVGRHEQPGPQRAVAARNREVAHGVHRRQHGLPHRAPEAFALGPDVHARVEWTTYISPGDDR